MVNMRLSPVITNFISFKNLMSFYQRESNTLFLNCLHIYLVTGRENDEENAGFIILIISILYNILRKSSDR